MWNRLQFGFVAVLLLGIGCSSSSDGSSDALGGGAGASSGGSSSGGSLAGRAGNGASVGFSGSAGLSSAGASGSGTSGGGAGSASAGSTSGGAGGPSDPCSASGLVLCDGFEQAALGAQPTNAPWLASNCFDMTHVLKVDAAVAHGGQRSLVSQGIPYADCQLHADLGNLSNFYVRAWVYYAAGAADQFEAHEVSVFELVPAAGTDDPSIRVGFRGNTCIPEGVEVNITGGMEQTGCTGATPAAAKWTCYELHVQSSESGTTADLAIDGSVQSFTNHGEPQQHVTNPDLKSVRYLRLGDRSYSGDYAPLVYVDDVAVGTKPIGCQ